ncbi:MAG TPA: TetR/AcrR family transcriptional regulator [Syntrophomonadaceae bacterium]|nr:TetR/AcrR family transcriptional regulator [Syntrophomonadaceae bacterium]
MRNQIMAAAIEEITEFGIKFTMSDLVKRLSISKSTLYAHFKSKEELIGAIIDDSLTTMRQNEKNILDNNTLNVIEKLKALSVIHPPLTINIRVMLDLKRYFTEEWVKIQQHSIEKWETIEFLIKQGIADGYFRSIDLAILRTIFNGAEKELMDQSFFIHNSLSFNDAMNQVSDILFRGIMNTDDSGEL